MKTADIKHRQYRIALANMAYERIAAHVSSDDPSPLPDDEVIKLAEAFAMIIDDEAVTAFARGIRTVRERERSEAAAAEREV